MREAKEQRVLLLSGGSRGFGLEVVRDNLARGLSVATFARSETAAMRELAAAHSNAFRFRALDACDTAAVDAFVQQVVTDFGRIDLLVNSAAVGQDHLLVHMSPALIRTVIDTNLTAPVLLTRTVLKHMLLQGAGRIVNISSICAVRGFAGLGVYSGTKGALDAFTRSIAREYGARGILINCLAPGFFASEMSSVLSAEQLETIRRRTPVGRLVHDSDLMPVLAMLLHEDTLVTGQTFVVDGGASA